MAHIESYLPKGTQCTVRQPGKAPVNYTTGTDQVVTTHTASECPLGLSTRCYSGNWLRDRHTTIKGCDVWFAARSLRQRIIVPDTDTVPDVYTHPLVKVDYDIPTALGQAYAFRIAAEWHKLGVKSSKSAWIIRAGDIPHNLIAQMIEDGCTVCPDPIDPSGTKQAIHRAIVALQQQVDTYVQGANETLANATEKLNNSEVEGTDYEKAVEDALKAAKALEKRMEKYRETMVPGASKLGINNTAWSPDRMVVVAKATANDLRARARAYRRGTQALATSTDPTARALATDAVNNTLPAYVMADALRESGDDAAADEVSSTFSLVDGDN